jgi:very-short-patch-repair endonuclease
VGLERSTVRFVGSRRPRPAGQRLALEYDGRAVHEREDVFVRDRRRANDLARAGWTVLRFTAADLRGGAAAAVLQVRACAAA